MSARNWRSLLFSCCTSTEEEMQTVDLDPFRRLYTDPDIEEGQFVNPYREDRQVVNLSTPRLQFVDSFVQDRQVEQLPSPSLCVSEDANNLKKFFDLNSFKKLYKERQQYSQPQDKSSSPRDENETIINPFESIARLSGPSDCLYKQGVAFELKEIKPQRTLYKQRQHYSQPQSLYAVSEENKPLYKQRQHYSQPQGLNAASEVNKPLFKQRQHYSQPQGLNAAFEETKPKVNKNFGQAVSLPRPSDSLGLNVRRLDTTKPAENMPTTILVKGARPKTVKKRVRFLLQDDTEKVHKKIKKTNIKKNNNKDNNPKAKIENKDVYRVYKRCYVGDIEHDLYV